jgi:Rrf2 family iron-sulfur cluster assembly transcriptional regulator
MKLTTKGHYALQSILDIVNNGNGRPVRLVDIANRQDLPLSYLEQIFRNLRKSEIVKSVRGPGGGYILSRNIKDITVSQVLTGVNELMRYADIVDKPKKATAEHRLMHRFFQGLDKTVFEKLNNITIEDIIKGN